MTEARTSRKAPTTLEDTASAPRRALVVLGMHRSGTSAMSRVLALSGAQLPRTLLPPAEDNPTGFWESSRIVSVNDEALRAVDLRWDGVFAARPQTYLSNFDTFFLGKAAEALTEEFDDRDPIVLKDPRTSLLLGVWKRVFETKGFEPTYVICVRNPLEVAQSLLERKGGSAVNFSSQKAILLWANYMLAAERDTRGQRRVFVSYSDLLGDWRRQIKRIEACAGFPLPRKTDAAAIDIDGFLTESLRHHETSDEQFLQRAEIPDFIKSTYKWMVAASRDQLGTPDAPDEASRELDKVESVVGGVLASAVQQIEAQATEIAGLRGSSADAAALMAERDSLREARDRSIQRLTAVETSLTQLSSVNDRLLIRIEELESRESALPERDAEIARLNAAVGEKTSQLEELERQVHDYSGRTAELGLALQDRDHRIGDLDRQVHDRDHRIGDLDRQVQERDLRIGDLDGQIQERDKQALDLMRQIEGLDVQAEALRQTLRSHEAQEGLQAAELASAAVELSNSRADLIARETQLKATQGRLAQVEVEAQTSGRRAEEAERAAASLRASTAGLAVELQERQNDIDRLQRGQNDLRHHIEQQAQRAAEVQTDYEAIRAQRDAILASTSWRLSAPLRSLMSRGRRD